ncbi:uncharacterized protein LOC135497214 [Lineus longissimus]|uniref:uncharacterized protein LOC135497214 n=1 Tax=Lineus longissimus TaxID=88925 RepID=UPI00315D5B6F
MESKQTTDIHSEEEIPNQTRSDSISTTASDVTNDTVDDEGERMSVGHSFIRVSSPGPDGAKNITEISGSSLGKTLDNVNLNISVNVNKTSLKGQKVKDEPKHKEQTIDVAPKLGVKAVAKEESESKKDKDGKYTIDLQFTINMDNIKKGKGHKGRRRRDKSDSELNEGGDRGREEGGSDDDDVDLGEGAIGGLQYDVIPEEPENTSASGTPRGSLGLEGDNGNFLAKKLGTGYLSGYDSGYFDYGKKQATDLEAQERDEGQASLRISASPDDTGTNTGDAEEDRESMLQRQDSAEKSKKKSKSYIRKERAKKLKDEVTPEPRPRRRSAVELGSRSAVEGQGQQQTKPGRRLSVTSANEQHMMGSSDEEALNGSDTGKLDTLIMLNKLNNFLKKNMPGLKQKSDHRTERGSQPVVMNGASYAADLDNKMLEIASGEDLDTSFISNTTTEDGEHSGEVTPRNASDTEEEEGMLEALTPRNANPERRARSSLPQSENNQPDKSNKQTTQRKTLTRQYAKEDYLTPQDLGASSQTNTPTQADESMRPGRLADRRRQINSVPSIEVSNENNETVEVVKPKVQDVPKSPKIQRAKSESAVSQGLLAPYCKLDMGNGTDGDEVFTLSANRSPHFSAKHGLHRTETLQMDSTGRTRAEIVLDCDHAENLTAEELGITLGEGEELRVLPVLVLDADTDGTEGNPAEERPEFPHSFAPIGIIPLSDKKENLTQQELGHITEKAEEILKETERGKMFKAVPSPNFHVGRPKAPTVTRTRVLRPAATGTQPKQLQTQEEPALPVTMMMKSPQIGRRTMSECGSPRGSPRVKRAIYKEFFEPTRRVTRQENELCSPIEKRHHDVIEGLNQMQFERQISGEDISTSGLGGYHKDLRYQRRSSRDSVGSDSSSAGSKEDQKQERVFVFPPTVPARNSYRIDSDREDTASISSGSGASVGAGDSIRERKKSLEEKVKQGENRPPRPRPPRTLNFSSVSDMRDDIKRKLSDGDNVQPVLDGNRTRQPPEAKLTAFEKPPEYAGVRSKFEKMMAHDGLQSPTLSRRPDTGSGGLSITRDSQFSKTVEDKPATVAKKPEQSWTLRQREPERSKCASAPTNSNTSSSRIKSYPPPRTDDEWFMPSFVPKTKGGEKDTKEKEKPSPRDVSPFRVENTDWFYTEPEVAGQQQSSRTLTIPGSSGARQKRHQWSGAVQQQNRDPSDSGTKSRSGNQKSAPKLLLNSNNNARKSRDGEEQDWQFLQKTESPKTQSSPVQLKKHARSKTDEPRYGLTVQAESKHERSRSSDGNNYGLTLQTSARPRTVSQGSEADDVFVSYPNNSTSRSPSLSRASSQPQTVGSQNPFKDYRPVGRHQPIVIDGRTPPKPQPASTSPNIPSRTLSDVQRSKPIPVRGQSLQSPYPQMSRSNPSQSSMSGLAMKAIANDTRNYPSTSFDSSRGDCQQGYPSMASVDSGWYSDRLDSTMSDVFDQEGYTSDTTETPRAVPGRNFFPGYNGRADDSVKSPDPKPQLDSAINQLLDENDGYGSDDELFRQRCIDVFKTLHHEDVVYQQFQKLLRFRQRRISLHKDNFKIIPKKDDRNESDSDGNMAYLV